MGADDCGYDFIGRYSDDEIIDLYEDRIYHARKAMGKFSLDAAIEYMKDADYYEDILRQRGKYDFEKDYTPNNGKRDD